ncbi:MAG: carbohydrate kinase family protein [Chloroflexi bacterium]|nr:carbohydrate kinase family protein [Chloroflexota bacterium]MCI0579365.1 carbohydrate kinase family protein [Chloroflexota bacterium]MCI0646213.1 carbohydrate kinase family protein [Chloroflexota bacterium]MCI0726918.1 carbohydrate kinase family protein [Chloroflexota bacterium]
MRLHFVAGGGMRVDYLVTHDGRAELGLLGGNALYAAVGAAIWGVRVGLWARLGENYPYAWLDQLKHTTLDTAGLKRIPGRQEHRTFYAYTPSGHRDDTDPAGHFARIGRPLPPELADYVHSTPGQDDPAAYEPLALRPQEWPAAYESAEAIHLSPLSIRTHREVSAHLRRRGIHQITVDPGERYMVPKLAGHIRRFLPQVTAFLPSDQEVRSLFGRDTSLAQAAETLGQWGAPLVVVKNGAEGVLVYEPAHGRLTHLPAFHRPGDGRVVDVTGAGDAFCGGFMVGLAQSGDPLQAARMGLVSASLVIEGYGALYALGRRPEEAQQRLAAIG